MNYRVQEIHSQAPSRVSFLQLTLGFSKDNIYGTMSILTSQKINYYYDTYKDIEVTFTKDVIKTTRLLTRHVYLKCLGTQWPCIIYSTSMSGAKIIANLDSASFELIRKANNLVSLRFAFHIEDKKDKLLFFVSAKVTGFSQYSKDNNSLNFVNLTYTKRPAEDLIAILGQMLEININSKKRTEERIVINDDTVRKLGLKTKNSRISIDSIPRNCILRDLSFSGAKVIIQGVAKFLIDKECVIVLIRQDGTPLVLKGKTVRYEKVEGRKDLAALAIHFHEDSVPMEYKKMINSYITVKHNNG